MAIQFSCPSCRQPIEVDLELAGREVECPYCHNVVTAPMASTYMASPNVPTARGLANAAALAGPGDPTIRPPGNPAALWGLGLACLCFVLFLAAVLLIGASVPAEFSEKLPGQLAEQPTDPPWDPKSDSLPPALVAGVMRLLVSLGVWVVGLVCAVLGLRGQRRRGFAWAGIGLLSIMGLFWLIGFVLMTVGAVVEGSATGARLRTASYFFA